MINRIAAKFRLAIFLAGMAAWGIQTAQAEYDPTGGQAAAAARESAGKAKVSAALLEAPGVGLNLAAAAEVESGLREVANVTWWGITDDMTTALQTALDTGATTVVLPYTGSAWTLSNTVHLVSRQDVLLEDGVVLEAKAGAFQAFGASFFTALNIEAASLIGYGATLRMRRDDYSSAPYIASESRHILYLYGCNGVTVQGLQIEESGGDGILVSDSNYPPVEGPTRHARDLTIQDCVFDRNYRQGLSLEDGINVLVENCRFTNTSGTPPMNGVDIEPFNLTTRVLDGIIFRHCVFSGNQGGGMTINRGLQSSSPLTDILVENCHFDNNGGSSGSNIRITSVTDSYPQPEGSILFQDCLIENCTEAGIWVTHKSSKSVPIHFVRCTLQNVATRYGSYPYTSRPLQLDEPGNWWKGRPVWPIYIYLPHDDSTRYPGGIIFDELRIVDSYDRPALWFEEYETDHGIYDLQGDITVSGPGTARYDIGSHFTNINLTMIDE